jgi:Cu(I)/Ag(I) efflux system membrane fusion protein
MKHSNKYILIALLLGSNLAFFSSCGNKEQKAEENGAKTTEAPVAASTGPNKDLFSAYIDVKNALIKDDASTAQAEAKDIITQLGSTKMEGLDSTKMKDWNALSKSITDNTNQIIGSADLKVQRTAFDALSKAMVLAVKNFNIPHGPAFRHYCPMAFDDKGAYWLSEVAEINNPYFGAKSEMAHCGADSGQYAVPVKKQ